MKNLESGSRVITNDEAEDKTKVGYIRVSTADQNEERQIENMKHLNLYKIYIEKISAKDTNRPFLKQMLDYVREGDTIYINDFSRLARSNQDLLNIISLLENKGVKLISHKEKFDTNSPTGKLMLGMIGAINEFERSNLLDRQREGIEIAKRKGLYKGRKAIEKPENFDEIYKLYAKRTITGTEAIKRTGLKRNTFYKFVNELKETE
jgi:DNA invertase Pin-like site-specific DNA recombinase